MNRSTHVNIGCLMLFALITVFTACKNVEEEKTTKEEKIIEPVMPTGSIGGVLDTLWIDGASFASVANGAMFFSFSFREKDTLTLHGWNDKVKKPRFNPAPNIRLLKGKASTISYGPIVTFGNVLLSKQDVDSILKVLKNPAGKYVLFAPKNVGEGIGYTIFISKYDPTSLVNTPPEPTGIDANPSPPKEW